MSSRQELKAWVDPELPKMLMGRIAPLELQSEDDPESLMQRALIRKGQLEVIAILNGIVASQNKKGRA